MRPLLTLLFLACAALGFLTVASTARASPPTVERCSWAQPGADRYTGQVPSAVQAYADIPVPARAALAARLEKRQYDEIATITRDDIVGGRARYTGLRDMHFGTGRICRQVDRRAWAATTAQLAFVYCEGPHCIVVPFVCSNVARVDREALPPLQLVADDRMVFEPPAAGALPTIALEPGGNGLQPREPWLRLAAPDGVVLPPLVDDVELDPLRPPNVPPVLAPLSPPVVVIVTPPPPPPPIPEPGTAALALAGLGVVLALARRRGAAR